MKMAMIVAMDMDGCIGKGNGLPWRLSSDMARFKRLTEADGFNSVVMGRRTWESLPDRFRPLPERVNIVMSRDTDWEGEGAVTALYVGRAIEIAFAEGSDECWIKVEPRYMRCSWTEWRKFTLLRFKRIRVAMFSSQSGIDHCGANS